MEDRTAAILRAYRDAFGQESRDRIALASGLTVPEACAAAMLPFQIIAAVRNTDPVTSDQCRQAMIDEGASILLGDDPPLLRFQTEEDAEAAKQRLTERLPNSGAVWIITHDVGAVEQWADADIP